jgi:hypothetical protein
MLPELADQARAAQVAIALSYGPYDGIEADHDDNGPVGKHINNVVIVKQLDNIVIVRPAKALDARVSATAPTSASSSPSRRTTPAET